MLRQGAGGSQPWRKLTRSMDNPRCRDPDGDAQLGGQSGCSWLQPSRQATCRCGIETLGKAGETFDVELLDERSKLGIHVRFLVGGIVCHDDCDRAPRFSRHVLVDEIFENLNGKTKMVSTFDF